MELIDRYVYHVGRRLPQRTRADVEQELHSLLIDALEERAGQKAEFTQEEQIAVLEEFGPPEQMAEKYRPQPKYLIGPKVYDLYLIVLFAIGVAALVATLAVAAVSILGAGPEGVNLLKLLAQSWTIFINIVLNGLGMATLVFVILERVIPDEGIQLSEDKEWNPRDMPEIEARDEVKRGGLIVEIAFLLLLLIGLGAFGDRLTAGAYYDGVWHSGPRLFSEMFFSTYLPLFGVRWSLTIVLNLVLIRQGRWQFGTRIADLVFHGLDIFIVSWLLTGPSVLNPAAFQTVLPGAEANSLLRLADNGLKIGFLIALIVTIIEVIRQVYRLIRDRSATVALPVKAR